MTNTDNPLATAAEWRRAGKGVALATVVSTWGSSPRPPGSQLAVDETGTFVLSFQGQYSRFVNYAPDSYAEGVLRG